MTGHTKDPPPEAIPRVPAIWVLGPFGVLALTVCPQRLCFKPSSFSRFSSATSFDVMQLFFDFEDLDEMEAGTWVTPGVTLHPNTPRTLLQSGRPFSSSGPSFSTGPTWRHVPNRDKNWHESISTRTGSETRAALSNTLCHRLPRRARKRWDRRSH